MADLDLVEAASEVRAAEPASPSSVRSAPRHGHGRAQVRRDLRSPCRLLATEGRPTFGGDKRSEQIARFQLSLPSQGGREHNSRCLEQLRQLCVRGVLALFAGRFGPRIWRTRCCDAPNVPLSSGKVIVLAPVVVAAGKGAELALGRPSVAKIKEGKSTRRIAQSALKAALLQSGRVAHPARRPALCRAATDTRAVALRTLDPVLFRPSSERLPCPRTCRRP